MVITKKEFDDEIGGYFKRDCVYCEIFIGNMMEGRKFKDRKIKK